MGKSADRGVKWSFATASQEQERRMSRRDTIIIAVLLNAGLLIVLFATSLKSETIPQESMTVAATPATPLKVEQSAIPVPSIVPTAPAPQIKTAAAPDEVTE